MHAKSFGRLALQILLLAVLLIAINGFGSTFLPSMESPAPAANAADSTPSAPSGASLGLILLVLLLQTIALVYPVLRSGWRGWRLAVSVAVLYFGTVTFMSQIESLVYLGDTMPEGMISGLFAMGLFNAIVFAPIAVLVLGRWRKRQPKTAPDEQVPLGIRLGPLAGRALVGAGVFLALYYLFGYFVAWQSPAVREYYGGTDPGSFFAQMASVVEGTPWMLPFQFVRGLLWVALSLLVLRMMRTGWWEVGMAASLLFAVPSLYLLFPNPLMPEPVRLAHLAETLPYQFLFGWFAAWLFRPFTCCRPRLGRAT